MFGDFRFRLGMPSRSSQSETMGSSSSLSACSNGQCASSSLTERASLCNIGSTSLPILDPLSQQDMPECSISTNQSGNGPDQSIMCHLMSLPSSGSLRSTTCTARSLENLSLALASEDQEPHRGGGDQPWWEAYQVYNQGKCQNQVSECKYRHVCTCCRREGHVKKDCAVREDWRVCGERREAKVNERVAVGKGGGWDRTHRIVFIDGGAAPVPTSGSAQGWS